MSGLPINATDCHVHVQSAAEATTLLRAMDRAGICRAVIMGSSRFTITLRPQDGFTKFHENNTALLKVRRAYPDRFAVWPTLDPTALDNCSRLAQYVDDGASGLKLYVGHAYSWGDPPRYLFHTTSIDSYLLQPVYEMCANAGLPVCIHVNTTDNAPGFREEFERVLAAFPRLRVLAPHWMLAVRRPEYMRDMLQCYPQVMTDTSFGQDEFLVAGLRNISSRAASIRALVCDFPNRVMHGTDLVCTSARHKTADWMVARMRAYREMLTEEEYCCPITQEKRHGLALPTTVLAGVLTENARLLAV